MEFTAPLISWARGKLTHSSLPLPSGWDLVFLALTTFEPQNVLNLFLFLGMYFVQLCDNLTAQTMAFDLAWKMWQICVLVNMKGQPSPYDQPFMTFDISAIFCKRSAIFLIFRLVSGLYFNCYDPKNVWWKVQPFLNICSETMFFLDFKPRYITTLYLVTLRECQHFEFVYAEVSNHAQKSGMSSKNDPKIRIVMYEMYTPNFGTSPYVFIGKFPPGAIPCVIS